MSSTAAAMTQSANTEKAIAVRPPSVIGHLASLQAGEIALPPFFTMRDEGLCVDTSQLAGPAELLAEIQHVFAENLYFLYLDYTCFTKLLYDVGQPLHYIYATSPLVRLAADIVAFQPERRALYRPVKVFRNQAEYFFEPVFLLDEQTDSNAPVDTSLRFDEFVAAMWSYGIRFGIDEKVVREAILAGKRDRRIIAKALDEQPGKPAGFKELIKELRRDDAPTELSNGKLDLRHFKNRFPQVGKGIRIIKKTPVVIGRPGFNLTGKAIIPPIPADFDLASLVGENTALERTDEGEFIVSLQGGFLTLDSTSNQISITDKIINREGVSARTTGDLHLSGDEYEEHGVIQEQRTVRGKNIAIHADVFGSVYSNGGSIVLKHNLIGGMAVNEEGDITVGNVASGAVLKTKKGNVAAKRAERCAIIGTNVSIVEAYNCDILADQVTIKVARGCTIAAKSIHLSSAAPHKSSNMLVFIQVPDISEFDIKANVLKSGISETEANLQRSWEELEKVTELPEFNKYRLLATKLRNNEIRLTPEQLTGFKKLKTSVEPLLRQSTEISTKIKKIKAIQQQFTDQLNQLEAQKKIDQEGVNCTIDAVNGDLIVCTTTVKFNKDFVHDLSAKDWHSQLSALSATGSKLFSGNSGGFAWQYHKVEEQQR